MNYRKQNRRSGFVLLEVLPAILVFSTLLVSGARLFWVYMRMEETVRSVGKNESALNHVLKSWESNNGAVAFAVEGTGGEWDVYDFPDETWLPDDPDGRRGDWKLFRRQFTALDTGQTWWDVEIGNLMTSDHIDWTWQQRIFVDPFTDNPGLRETK